MYKELLEKVKELALEVSGLAKRDEHLFIKKKGAKDFVTETDLKISEYLSVRLPQLLQDSIVISEEGDTRQLTNRYCWIIDPIDGTSNYIFGWREFCISIGLVENGTPVLGVVYSPGTNELFEAAKGEGARCNGKPIHVSAEEHTGDTLILAETNPYGNRALGTLPRLFGKIFPDCIDLRITGSAALDCCYVACGRGGAFFAESLKPWDFAAGEIILAEAGGKLTAWDGSKSVFVGNFNAIATNGLVHDEMLEKMKEFI